MKVIPILVYLSFSNISEASHSSLLSWLAMASNKGPNSGSVTPPPTGVRGRMERKRPKTLYPLLQGSEV